VSGARDRLVIAPSQRRRTIVGAIRTARERLALSIFRCDDRVVLEALRAAARRGVHVRVLMTPRARAAGSELEALHAWLAGHGIEVRRYTGGMKYHAKYLVADARLALVTTLNLTTRCFERTCDFTLTTPDPAVVSGLTALFDADWSATPLHFTAAQRERLIVGPDHAPRERFAALVHEARRCIRILDAKLADEHLVGLLDDRERRGIAVERARRRDVRPLRRHGKLLIVDGDAAVIGSLALSAHALDGRRELAVVTRDPRVVAELDAFWHARLARRRPVADARLRAASLEVGS
jgi:phosphatidylserine/phosphatidylglycerophosphate/cardiolipin synthase-like enzyme